MTPLEQARKEIEEIDKEMAALFERRMRDSKVIGEYKKQNNLPIKDASREELLLTKNSAYIKNATFIPYYKEFQKNVMEISCEYQEEIKKRGETE